MADGAGTYYDLLARDPDVVKVVLLLTGSVEGMKAQTVDYLSESCCAVLCIALLRCAALCCAVAGSQCSGARPLANTRCIMPLPPH